MQNRPNRAPRVRSLPVLAGLLLLALGCGDTDFAVGVNNGVGTAGGSTGGGGQRSGTTIIVSTGGFDGGSGAGASLAKATREGPQRFRSRSQLQAFLEDSWEAAAVPGCLPLRRPLGAPVLFAPALPVATLAADGAGVSAPNDQVNGVGEGDFVASDGEHAYVAGDGRVHVVDLRDPLALAERAVIEVGTPILELHLEAERLAIVHDATEADDAGPADRRTGLQVHDVEAPDAPRLLAERLFDGHYLGGRRIEERLHLVLQHSLLDPRRAPCGCNVVLPVPTPLPVVQPLPAPAVEPSLEAARAPALAFCDETAVEEAELSVADRLPGHYRVKKRAKKRVKSRLKDRDGGEAFRRKGKLLRPRDVLRPAGPHARSLTYVSTVDLRSPRKKRRGRGLLADVSTVYASREALYLVERGAWLGGGEPSTWIHKLPFADRRLARSARGEVPGQVPDALALDEHEGHLRVVSHRRTDPAGRFALSTRLTVLDEALEEVGAVEEIAPGEILFATRMIGDMGYVVTFRQVDPLFTIDLSRPEAPAVLGELHIPGWSDYLHPVDDDHLLGIGRNDLTGALQASLFDVSDPREPWRSDWIELPGIADEGHRVRATLEHDPRAFAFRTADGAVGMPLERRWEQPASGSVALLTVTPERGIEWLGEVEALSLDEEGAAPVPFAARALLVDDVAYALSPRHVVAVWRDAPDAPLDVLDLGAASSEEGAEEAPGP